MNTDSFAAKERKGRKDFSTADGRVMDTN